MSQLADYEAGRKRGTNRATVIPRHVELASFALEHLNEDLASSAFARHHFINSSLHLGHKSARLVGTAGSSFPSPMSPPDPTRWHRD